MFCAQIQIFYQKPTLTITVTSPKTLSIYGNRYQMRTLTPKSLIIYGNRYEKRSFNRHVLCFFCFFWTLCSYSTLSQNFALSSEFSRYFTQLSVYLLYIKKVWCLTPPNPTKTICRPQNRAFYANISTTIMLFPNLSSVP